MFEPNKFGGVGKKKSTAIYTTGKFERKAVSWFYLFLDY